MGKFIANIINDFLNRVRGILGTQEPEFCQKLEDEFYQPEADDQKGKKSASAPRSLKSDFTGGLIISGSSSSSVNSEDLYKKLEKALEIFNQVVDGRGEIENFFRQIEKITDAENSQLENIKKEELTNSSISDDIAKFKRLTREIEVLTRQIKVAEENLKRTPEEDRDEKNTRAKDEDNNNSVQLSGNIRRLADKIENIVGSLKGEEGKKQLKEYNENTENQEKFKNELSDKYGLDLPHSLFLEEDGKIKEREAGKVYLRDVCQHNTQLTEGTANITAVKFRQATASLIGDKLCSEENLSELDLDNSVQQIKNYFANFGIKPEDYSFFTYFPLLASQIREKDQKKVLTEGKALFWETANIEKSSEKKTEKTGETPIIEIPLDTTNDGIHKKIFVNGNLANPLTVEITGLDKIHKHASKYFATYKIQPVIVSIVEDGNTRNININELNLLYKEINFEPDYNMTEEENKCVVRAEVPGLIEEFVDFNNHSSLKIGENKIIQVGDEIQIKFTASEDNKKTDKEGNIELRITAGISDNLKNILNTDSLLDRAELVAGYLTYYNTGNLTSDDLAKAYPIYQKIKGGEVSFADSSTVGLERSIEELKSLAVKFSSDYQALIPIIRELETYSEYAEEPLMIAKLKDYQKEIDTYKNSFRSVSNLPIFPPYTGVNFPPYVGAGLEPTEYRIFQLDYNKKTAIKNQLTEIESSAKANAAAYQKELDTINEIFRKNITTDYNDSNTPTGLNLNLIEEDIATLQQFTPKAGAITALSHTQQAQGKIYKSQGKRILFWELSLLKLHYKEKNKDLLSDYEKNKLLASNKLKGLAEGFVLPNFLGEKEVKTLDNDFNQLTTRGESELANGVLDKPALTNLNDFKKSKSTDTKNQAYQAINSQSDNPNRAEKLLNALKDLKAAKESRLFDKSVAGSEADNLETREKVKAAHRLLTTLRTIRGTETLDD
ncbi:21882_t:CDS:10 [Entrophospora sp. SA101]|nr:21882_t:CDS:10 [Entrophospora sp. SA101]